MKKRVIAFFVLFVMILTVLVGCAKVKDTSAMLSLGEKYLSELNYEQAVVQFLKVIDIEPKNVRAYLGGADAYLHLDKQPEAVDLLAQGVANTGNPNIQHALDGVEISGIDGYIAIAEAYRAEGWQDREIELLNRVYKETGDERIVIILRENYPREAEKLESESGFDDEKPEGGSESDSGDAKPNSRNISISDYERLGGHAIIGEVMLDLDFDGQPELLVTLDRGEDKNFAETNVYRCDTKGGLEYIGSFMNYRDAGDLVLGCMPSKRGWFHMTYYDYKTKTGSPNGSLDYDYIMRLEGDSLTFEEVIKADFSIKYNYEYNYQYIDGVKTLWLDGAKATITETTQGNYTRYAINGKIQSNNEYDCYSEEDTVRAYKEKYCSENITDAYSLCNDDAVYVNSYGDRALIDKADEPAGFLEGTVDDTSHLYYRYASSIPASGYDINSEMKSEVDAHVEAEYTEFFQETGIIPYKYMIFKDMEYDANTEETLIDGRSIETYLRGLYNSNFSDQNHVVFFVIYNNEWGGSIRVIYMGDNVCKLLGLDSNTTYINSQYDDKQTPEQFKYKYFGKSENELKKRVQTLSGYVVARRSNSKLKDYTWFQQEGGRGKPVIYLYPEKTTDVSVKIGGDVLLTCTYPEYNGEWNVTAEPDGTLWDADGQEYYCLYWEGVAKSDYDFSRSFCVSSEDTADFLREKLTHIGLNAREVNEFVIYWLPILKNNQYNQIIFQTEQYAAEIPLTIAPAPDTQIRVFMAYKPLSEPVETKPQILPRYKRKGFTVVEWGGGKA